MKPRNLLWLANAAFAGGIFMQLFTTHQIAERLFGPTVGGGFILSFYSTGLVLVSAGWVSLYWGARIKTLEAKLARLEKAD